MKDIQQKIQKIVETPDWIPTLEPMTTYQRVQDDCDGDRRQRLEVMVGVDGDMHVRILGERTSLRFRNYFGGGASLRVHRALMILAEAIRLDNAENPQFNALSEEIEHE